MDSAETDTDNGEDVGAGPPQTVGGFEPEARAWVVVLFGVGGVVLGVLLPLLTRWALDLPWIPFRGPLSLLGSFDQPWLSWGRPLIGLLAGLLLAIWVIADSPVLHISPEQIRVQRHGQVNRVIERAKVDGVHRHRSKIIIESNSGRTLFEDDIEGDKTAIQTAFVRNGYPCEGPQN